MRIRTVYLGILAGLTLALLTVAGNGCKKSDTVMAADTVELCLKCGQIKGSDLCCKPGQTLCTDCGLVKGSPGCCSIPEGATSAAICTKCGQIAGTDLCCKPDQPLCPKCGLVAGSPGCCKLP